MQECLLRSDLAVELFGVPITDMRVGGGVGEGGSEQFLFIPVQRGSRSP